MATRRRKSSGSKSKAAEPAEKEWGSAAQILAWVKEAGFSLNRKNLYEHYGPSSSRPVQRKDGKWYWPEMLERLRLNQGGEKLDESQAAKIALVRAAAEARLKKAMAERAERRNRLEAREVVERGEVKAMLGQLMREVRRAEQSLARRLPRKLAGLGTAAQTTLIEAELQAAWRAIAQAMAEWETDTSNA